MVEVVLRTIDVPPARNWFELPVVQGAQRNDFCKRFEPSAIHNPVVELSSGKCLQECIGSDSTEWFLV